MIDWPKKMRLNHQGTAAYLLPASDGTPSGTEVLVYPADQIERDWSMLEASQASLREHMLEIDRLRGQNERLRDELVATEERSGVLRELVREALRRHVWSPEWDERAEKALEGK